MKKDDYTKSKTSSRMGGQCRVFFGSKLPEYTTEHHIREHFREFAPNIRNIELVCDEKTNKFKGYGFIFFSRNKVAQEAIRALHLSTLFGMCIDVKFSSNFPLNLEESSSDSTVTPGLVTSGDHMIKQSQSSESTSSNGLSSPMVRPISSSHSPEFSRSQSEKLAPQSPSHVQPLMGGSSVKVTHLPPTVTKEKLYSHFKQAGEIKGEPVIHVVDSSKYAHVNFHDPHSAQSAVSMLNNSVLDGVTIRVKVARLQTQKAKSLEQCSHEKILRLDSNQWNTLMLNSSGRAALKEIMSPFDSNQNVIIQPLFKDQSVRFSGKRDAVEDAYMFLWRSLNKELPIDR